MLFNKSFQNLEEVHNEDKLIDQLLQPFNIIKHVTSHLAKVLELMIVAIK